MKSRSSIVRAAVFAAVLVGSLCVAPLALARTHVNIGIAVPGVSVGVGNCWNCGYWAAPPPPVYYSAPAYYPEPVYYAPPPVYYPSATVYYGYGQRYAPHAGYRYRGHRGGHGYYRGNQGSHRGRGHSSHGHR